MVTRSIALFVLTGLCEVGGGYLVWLWLRDQRSVVLGVIGGLVLSLYGVLPILQPPTSVASTRPTAAYSLSYRCSGGWWIAVIAPIFRTSSEA